VFTSSTRLNEADDSISSSSSGAIPGVVDQHIDRAEPVERRPHEAPRHRPPRSRRTRLQRHPPHQRAVAPPALRAVQSAWPPSPTLTPAAASTSANRAPRPEEAPVTRATRPSIRNSSRGVEHGPDSMALGEHARTANRSGSRESKRPGRSHLPGNCGILLDERIEPGHPLHRPRRSETRPSACTPRQVLPVVRIPIDGQRGPADRGGGTPTRAGSAGPLRLLIDRTPQPPFRHRERDRQHPRPPLTVEPAEPANTSVLQKLVWPRAADRLG